MFVVVLVVPEERRLALSVPSLEMMEEFASWVVGTPEVVLREAGTDAGGFASAGGAVGAGWSVVQ